MKKKNTLANQLSPSSFLHLPYTVHSTTTHCEVHLHIYKQPLLVLGPNTTTARPPVFSPPFFVVKVEHSTIFPSLIPSFFSCASSSTPAA